jgi:hypothetical protein
VTGGIASALIAIAGGLCAYLWKQRRRRREWDRNIELETSGFDEYRDNEDEDHRDSEIDLTAIQSGIF